jgi:hypothetical protein
MAILTTPRRRGIAARSRVAVALLVAVAAGAVAHGAAGAESAAPEYAVKAAFLSKFGAYVDWPSSAFESPTSPINLCIAGDDPFGATLDKVAAEQRVGARPIVVRRLKTVTRNAGCQILYIGGSESQTVAQALDAVRGSGVLTVTDAAKGDAAGIIQLVISDNRVRFNIDEESASADGLSISSKLLGLALSVKSRK